MDNQSFKKSDIVIIQDPKKAKNAAVFYHVQMKLSNESNSRQSTVNLQGSSEFKNTMKTLNEKYVKNVILHRHSNNFFHLITLIAQ